MSKSDPDCLESPHGGGCVYVHTELAELHIYMHELACEHDEAWLDEILERYRVTRLPATEFDQDFRVWVVPLKQE